jgi:hypothetical protein
LLILFSKSLLDKDNGLARFISVGITSEEWTKIHFREKFNPLGPLTSLPSDFYKRAYISLTLSKRDFENNINKREIFNRQWARFRDILESRIGKVTRMASAETSQNPKRLETEEKILFESLNKMITKWRNDLRLIGET